LDWGRGEPAPEPTTFDRAAAAAVNAAVEAESAGTPKHHELDPETARAQRRAAYVHSETRESLTATDPETGREIRFAFWRPSAPKPDGPDGEKHESPWSNGPRGIYLLFHGGGFVFGDAAGQNDERLERMAANLGVVVVVPDYRKAPENPYPAALEDCESAARWCEANAAAHFDMHERAGGTLVMGGESAGANLCASV
jgi:acetyl esterase/lipase